MSGRDQSHQLMCLSECITTALLLLGLLEGGFPNQAGMLHCAMHELRLQELLGTPATSVPNVAV